MDFSIRRYDINFYYQHWRRGVISIERRIPFSPIHFKINREIFDAAMEFMPNIIFVEKAKYLFSSTILKIRSYLPNVVFLHFSPDDYFNPNNINWLLKRNLFKFDRVITTKNHNLSELKKKYGNVVDYVYSGGPELYEKKSKKPFKYQVSFVGQFEGKRASSIVKLSNHAVIDVFGPDWDDLKGRYPNIRIHSPVWGDDYIETLRQSKINLCFLRKANNDQSTNRTFEIASVGGLMLAERTAEHLSFFKEGKESFFFESDEELITKVKEINSIDESSCAQVRDNIRARYVSSGYSYSNIWKNYIMSNFKFLC